jgi:hypothetical protein
LLRDGLTGTSANGLRVKQIASTRKNRNRDARSGAAAYESRLKPSRFEWLTGMTKSGEDSIE